MNATCEHCTCNGVGTCPACVQIRLTVAAEARPPARRTGCGPATVTPFDVEAAVRDSRGYLVAYAQRKIGNRQDAEDAVQDALVSLWINRGRYPALTGDPRALMVRYTRTQVLNSRRAHARRAWTLIGDWFNDAADQANGLYADHDSGGDGLCMGDPQVAKAVEAALSALPGRHRQAVRMHYIDRVPRAQAAARMGVSPGRFDNLAESGLRMLRRRAQDPGYAPGSWAKRETRDLVRRLAGSLDRLPPAEREVVRLRYLERLTAAETGRRVGRSASTVNQRTCSAVARLRRMASAGSGVAA